MNKKSSIIIAFVVIAVVGLAVWFFYGRTEPTSAPMEETVELTDDTVESINAALDEISAPDIDGELSEIDKAIGEL
ncbi:MAG: hypothetical protein PHP35_02160 [Candidatus Colwellbacteria bacterium]|nr:hypothetical protein [Candidatus Colwellbacteria bacterium]